jgi:hypothetical protein
MLIFSSFLLYDDLKPSGNFFVFAEIAVLGRIGKQEIEEFPFSIGLRRIKWQDEK